VSVILWSYPNSITKRSCLLQGSAGFRWWEAWDPGVVGSPMCGYRIFREGIIDEVTRISMDRYYL